MPTSKSTLTVPLAEILVMVFEETAEFGRIIVLFWKVVKIVLKI